MSDFVDEFLTQSGRHIKVVHQELVIFVRLQGKQ